MVDNSYDLNTVLAAYPPDCRPVGVEPAPIIGGFSGSRVWRLKTARGPLCLRRWPTEHPTASRLRWIHSLLAGASEHGFTLVPLPTSAQSGESFVHHDNHLWELTAWLPGEADRGELSGGLTLASRVQAAMTSLARFHRALAAVPNNNSICGPALGIVQRVGLIYGLQCGSLERLQRTIESNQRKWQELADRSSAVFRYFTQVAAPVADRVRAASRADVVNRTCIRDIHREHVLFNENEVTGIIDFGAMRLDSIACDIARLLGSMAHNDHDLWQAGLSAYEIVQPLSANERLLVRAYDESGVLLSGINWLKWVFIEDRRFDDRAGVLKRFDEITCRLANLASQRSGTAV
jgi:Ser/Thr protein kinase RdoA (MazF antagonist)